MNDKIELRGLFGTRWKFRAVGASRGLGIQAFKGDNKGDNPDVNVGLSLGEAERLRDFIVEKFGPGEGYVKVGEGMVNATAEGYDGREDMLGTFHELVEEAEPEVTWKYEVGDKVQVNDKAPRLLRGTVGEVTATSDHPYAYPSSIFAYTVRDANGSEYTFSESELDPYVEPKLGDLLAKLPVGTVIHFDSDTAPTTWVKRRSGWYESRHGTKMHTLQDSRASRWPFTVVYNPDEQ